MLLVFCKKNDVLRPEKGQTLFAALKYKIVAERCADVVVSLNRKTFFLSADTITSAIMATAQTQHVPITSIIFLISSRPFLSLSLSAGNPIIVFFLYVCDSLTCDEDVIQIQVDLRHCHLPSIVRKVAQNHRTSIFLEFRVIESGKWGGVV